MRQKSKKYVLHEVVVVDPAVVMVTQAGNCTGPLIAGRDCAGLGGEVFGVSSWALISCKIERIFLIQQAQHNTEVDMSRVYFSVECLTRV